MELFKGNIAEVITFSFQTLFVTYLLLILVEQIWAGSVQTYLNTNYFLFGVIIFGIMSVFSRSEIHSHKKSDWKDYTFVVIFGLGGAAIIYFKTSQLGVLSWFISILAGALIILLAILTHESE